MTAAPVLTSVPTGPRPPSPDGSSPRRRPLEALVGRPGAAVVAAAASKDVNAKVTLLVFAPGEPQPHLAVKVPTTALAESVVEREGRMLVELRRLRLRRLEETLPRFVAVLDAGGRTAVASTVVPGAPMLVAYHSWRHTSSPSRVRADFAAAASWLAAFQRETAVGSAPISILDGIPDAIAARWPEDPRLPTVLRILRRVGHRLSAVRTPRCVSHGDYWCGNLLLTDGVVSGVVDWECGEVRGEPLRDVVRFPLSYALYLDRHTRAGRTVRGHRGLTAGAPGAGIRYALDGNGWFPRLVRDYLAAQLDRLGVPGALWRDVALAGIADVAASADTRRFGELHLDLLVALGAAAAGPR